MLFPDVCILSFCLCLLCSCGEYLMKMSAYAKATLYKYKILKKSNFSSYGKKLLIYSPWETLAIILLLQKLTCDRYMSNWSRDPRSEYLT